MRRLIGLFALTVLNCGGNSSTTTGNDMALDMSVGVAVAVSGVVEAASTSSNTPLAGATVSVVGASPAISTTSASDGSFTLNVPSNQTVFVQASATGYVAGETGVVIAGGAVSDVNLSVLPLSLITSTLAGLSPALTLDTTKGIVNVNFSFQNGDGGSVSAVAGLDATLSATHGTPFTLGSSGAVYSNVTITGDQSTLIFPNVTTGTTTIAVVAPTGTTCTPSPAITNFRVDANTFTQVNFTCN